MKQGAKCPQCGGTFTKLNNYKCPLCETPLKLRRIKEGQTTKNVYVLIEQPKPEPVMSRPAITYIFGSVNAIEIENKKWHVYIATLLDALYCPNCKRKVIHNPTIRTGKFDHKCDRCNTITTYFFNI